MVTVTDNSVKQINAALLSIKKELGCCATSDATNANNSLLNNRIEVIENGIKDIMATLEDLQAQIDSIPRNSGGGSSPTPSTPDYYEDNLSGSVTYTPSSSSQSVSLGNLSHSYSSLISLSGTVGSQSVNSMSPYISGGTLYIRVPAAQGRAVVNTPTTLSYDVTVRYV